MSQKNKIYWSLGVTEKGTRALLTDENSKFKWLRSQRNRRVIVILELLGIFVVALGSYLPISEIGIFNLDTAGNVILVSIWAILVISLTLVAYSFLRIAVRGIADAPDELLDERQIQIRNTSYRYSYFAMGYLVLALLILVFFGPELELFQSEGNDGSYLVIAALFALASAPSMFIAWRERDI